MGKLKIIVPSLDKNFEFVEKEMSFDVSEYDNKTQEVWYKLHIPSHIYKRLLDTAPEYTVEKGFKPYIENTSIKGILMIFKSYCDEITYRDEVQKRPHREKLIFVRFNHTAKHDRCEWTGGYMGEIVSSSFQFFIGYKIMERVGLTLPGEEAKMVANYYTLIRYQKTSPLATVQKYDTNFQEGTELQPLHMKHDRKSFEEKYAIIEWTQEREDFLKSIENKFKELHKYLDEFLGDLSTEKLQKLIEQNQFKLLK